MKYHATIDRFRGPNYETAVIQVQCHDGLRRDIDWPRRMLPPYIQAGERLVIDVQKVLAEEQGAA